MLRDEFKRIDEMFQVALACCPKERPVVIAKACSDNPSLRERVEKLVSAYENAPPFLEKPAWFPIVRPASQEEAESSEVVVESDLPFERLGDFRFKRKLGEGGMGVVYLAEQESLERQVALKIIRPERVGSSGISERFVRESKVVAKLRHPNIVAVHGSGEEKGVRYFAMELLSGQNLDEKLREGASRGEKIPTRQAIGWIRDIARAVDCAHDAGVIHRDIKPSNIRITPDGRAMLMDFGIARQIKISTMTLIGEFRGTPCYASPEQVKSIPRGIDAGTDVYSLGVTLYEVVTGRVPFEGDITERIFNQILNDEPIAPRRLNPSISRDLDTVILKTMEKNSGHRYQTMAAFADDLEHVLNGEVIQAKPAGFVTKVWKRVSRHPVASAAISIATVTIFAFAVVVPWVVATKEREKRTVAEESRIEIEKQRSEAEKAKEKAEAVNDFLMEVFSSPHPRVNSKDIKVVDVLDEAVKKNETAFPDQPEIKAELYNTIGMTYYGLGLYNKAYVQFVAALERLRSVLGEKHPNILTTIHNLAAAFEKQGRYSEAEDLYRQASDGRLEVLGNKHPDTLISKNNLGVLYCAQDRASEAESLHWEVLDARRQVLGEKHPSTFQSLHNLAAACKKQGKYSEAEDFDRQALDGRREVLGDKHPDTLISMHAYASLCAAQENHGKAELIFRQVLRDRGEILGKEHPDTLITKSCLASTLDAQHKYSEAERLFRKVLDSHSRILGDEHPDTLGTMSDLAGVFYHRENYGEAEKFIQKVLETCRKAPEEKHLYTIQTLNKIIKLYETWNKPEKAATYRAHLAELEGLETPATKE